MSTIDTPPPGAAPTPRRNGFYVSPWVLAALGGLVLLGIGYVIGRVVDDRHHDGERPFFRGPGDEDHRGLAILVALIVLALIVAGVVLLVRHYMVPRGDTAMPAAASGTSAEQVLADRFARGEIDEAEFVSRRNVLRS
jgi:putative membrane protein